MADPRKSSLYQVLQVFEGTAGGPQAPLPYLIPPLYDQLLIPVIFGPNTAADRAAASIAGDFALTWQDGPIGSRLVALVTLPAYVWNVDTNSRAQLKAAFTAFRAALETLEFNGRVARGGAALIAQRTAEGMPLQVDEELFYRYGFNAAAGYVDLVAGMRLRIETAPSQFVAPGAPLNGYAPAGVCHWNISRTVSEDGERVAFDAFLGANRPPDIAVTDYTGSGGLIDLSASGMARRHVRLFYPASMPSAASGSSAIAQNVTIIGADTLGDLQNATDAYTASGTCAAAAPGNRPIFCLTLRGRAVAVPEIQILVNGASFFVPLGTTVRNIIDQYADWAYNALNMSPLLYKRYFMPIVTRGATPDDYTIAPMRTMDMSFVMAFPPVTSGWDPFDLPVLKGDQIKFIPII